LDFGFITEPNSLRRGTSELTKSIGSQSRKRHENRSAADALIARDRRQGKPRGEKKIKCDGMHFYIKMREREKKEATHVIILCVWYHIKEATDWLMIRAKNKVRGGSYLSAAYRADRRVYLAWSKDDDAPNLQ